MKKWVYKNKELSDSDIPEGSIGFIYKISHSDGRWYIGRKLLTQAATKMVKGKKKKFRKENDWREYWSSSEDIKTILNEEGDRNFKREILLFCKTTSAMTYSEEATLYMTGALFDPKCWNRNIRAKIFRKWFANKETDLHNKIMKALNG